MKSFLSQTVPVIGWLLASGSALFAEEQKAPVAEATEKQAPAVSKETILQKKVEKVTDDQDELQADAQDLAAGQTNQKIIEFIEECQNAMNDAIDNLEKFDTGKGTIAAQTEVIEKIYKAAEQKANGKSGSGMQGMLQMMQGMMGNSQSDTKTDKKGKSGQKEGQGGEGKSSSPSSSVKGNESDKKEPRRLAKTAGEAGLTYPDEFAKAMNAYNKSIDVQRQSPQPDSKAP